MMNTTFAERCAVSEQCLPDAPYRDMLSRLHADMLSEIEALRAALLLCARKAEGLKRPASFLDPESPQAIRNAQYQSISITAHIALGTIQGPSGAALQASGKADCDGGTCGVGGYCAKCKKAGGKAAQG